MIRKAMPVVVASVVTMILTTIFRPLEFLQSMAAAQSPIEQATDYPSCHGGICGTFLNYWYKHGGLQQFGYPITGLIRERSELDGKEYVVQYFERAVFELHPENQPPYNVLLSHLGAYKYKQKYPHDVDRNAIIREPMADPQPELGVNKVLSPGISIRLIRASHAAITGLAENNCGPEMTWVIQIENNGDSPYVAEVDTSSMTMRDSTGFTYAPNDTCEGRPTQPYSGSLGAPQTLKPGDILRGTISFRVIDIPHSADYFELELDISGKIARIRYMLP